MTNWQQITACTSLGAFLPTDMPSFQPMPRSMASPKEAIGMASYASKLASCRAPAPSIAVHLVSIHSRQSGLTYPVRMPPDFMLSHANASRIRKSISCCIHTSCQSPFLVVIKLCKLCKLPGFISTSYVLTLPQEAAWHLRRVLRWCMHTPGSLSMSDLNLASSQSRVVVPLSLGSAEGAAPAASLGLLISPYCTYSGINAGVNDFPFCRCISRQGP